MTAHVHHSREHSGMIQGLINERFDEKKKKIHSDEQALVDLAKSSRHQAAERFDFEG